MRPDVGIVGTSKCLFNGTVKDDRVQVLEFKMVLAGKDDVLKDTQVQPAGHVHAQVMEGHVFLRPQEIAVVAVEAGGQLGKNVGIVQLPDVRVQFQEQVIGAVV